MEKFADLPTKIFRFRVGAIHRGALGKRYGKFIAYLATHGEELSLVRREKLEAKIEQTIKRLIQLRAAKKARRQLEPKVINATAQNAV